MEKKQWVVLIILGVFSLGALPAQSIDGIMEKTVEELENAVDGKKGVGIGNFVYADMPVGSSFSRYLEDKLSTAIQQSGQFELVDRDKLEEIMAEIKLGLSGLIDESTAIEPGNLRGLDCLVSGRFFSEGTNAKVFIELLELETGVLLEKLEISIPLSQLPQEVSLTPDNYSDAMFIIEELAKVGNSSSDGLAIRAWTVRGDGGIYKDGENLVIHFFSNRDCYVKVYHIDVHGNMQLIFPNPYYSDNFISAQKIYKIPDNTYPFSFVLGEPYGTEFVKVLASTNQFSDIEEAFAVIGKASSQIVSRGLSVQKKEELTSEILISYTIIK